LETDGGVSTEDWSQSSSSRWLQHESFAEAEPENTDGEATTKNSTLEVSSRRLLTSAFRHHRFATLGKPNLIEGNDERRGSSHLNDDPIRIDAN
jgi:hypothetical protein